MASKSGSKAKTNNSKASNGKGGVKLTEKEIMNLIKTGKGPSKKKK